MAGCRQLDASRRARSKRVIAQLALFLFLLGSKARFGLGAQDSPSDAARLEAARAAFDASHWEETAKLSQGPPEQSPDLDFLAGLAFARLERWNDARGAFEAGHRKSPDDARFLVELAGVAYRQKELGTAKRDLHAALRLDPRDAYVREFLGTLYFLEGNLEAALKYWNAVDKPRLRTVDFVPAPKLRQEVLAHGVTFSAPQVLTRDALDDTRARLSNLGVYPHQRVELTASKSGDYDVTLDLDERNGWGDSKLEGVVSLLSGLPYETVYPEFYNLHREAVNFMSLVRWDSQKRRFTGELSAPLFHEPAQRIKILFDARNENWNLSRTLFAAGPPLTDLNLRRVAGGVELQSVVNGRWSWSTGLEFAHRSFRNLEGHTSAVDRPFFTDSNSFAYWLGGERSLIRDPERRFTLDSSVEARVGRGFNDALGPFATARGALRAHWFPRARGDDYEMQAQVRAGGTVGRVPLDELFQLGLERDNDLWLRGQPGTFERPQRSSSAGAPLFSGKLGDGQKYLPGSVFQREARPISG